MDLSDLRTFLDVVEHGSLQRVAQIRRTSRNAVRRQLDRLEEALDAPLLLRGARGTSLTPAGRELVAGATPLLDGASSLAERVRVASEEARGVLRFVVPTGLPVAPRARAIMALGELHPDLDVEVIEDEDPLSRIGDPFDLMFHLGKGPGREGWYSSVLLRLPVRLCATPAYLERHGTPASLDELDQHRLLFWSPLSSAEPQLTVRRRAPLPVRPWMRTSNLALLLALAEADAGLLYGPVFSAAVGGGDLRPVLEDTVGDKTELRALSPRSSRVDPRIRALLKNTRRLLRAME